jgi:DGQHR domain-containing protein
MQRLSYSAIRAKQGAPHAVFTIAARASDILRFASIDRIARSEDGALKGFQRHQIASHIREIREYLKKDEAVLPNSIVVAFIDGVEIKGTDTHPVLAFDLTDGPRGLVVDGQQRLSALAELPEKDFEAFVSILICADEAELRRQFILINNTRPLPKSLIYELLPSVAELPERLDNRSLAAALTARLNYDPDSSLRGMIYQHTNPDGIIRDTAIQRVIMQSLNDGVMRDFMRKKNGDNRCFELVSEFFLAVQNVFKEEWVGQTPKTSRLVHGAGIAALGYVMEVLALLDGARTSEQFAYGLACLQERTAWTAGHWDFDNADTRHWKAVQNVNRDVMLLAQHMIGIVRADIRKRRGSLAPTPLLDRAKQEEEEAA